VTYPSTDVVIPATILLITASLLLSPRTTTRTRRTHRTHFPQPRASPFACQSVIHQTLPRGHFPGADGVAANGQESGNGHSTSSRFFLDK